MKIYAVMVCDDHCGIPTARPLMQYTTHQAATNHLMDIWNAVDEAYAIDTAIGNPTPEELEALREGWMDLKANYYITVSDVKEEYDAPNGSHVILRTPGLRELSRRRGPVGTARPLR